MASLTGNSVASTYQSLIKISDNSSAGSTLENLTDGVGNTTSVWVSSDAAAISGSFAVSGSTTLSGSVSVVGNLTTTGTITGTLTGTAATASYVQNAQTASYVANAVSASYSSTADSAISASYSAVAATASYVENAQSASYVANAVSSSYALTASYALNGGGGGSVDTGSLLTTASVSLNTVTFTKGDNSTFSITVDTGSAAVSIDTGSFATTGSNTFFGDSQTYLSQNGLGSTAVHYPSGAFIYTSNESGSLSLSAINEGTLYLNADGGEGNVQVGYDGWDNNLVVKGNQVISGSINFGDGSLIQSISASSGDGGGYTTLTLKPNTSYASDQYIVLDPTTPNHIHIRAGGTIDSSSAYLYLGGEKANVVVRNLDNSFNEKYWVQINSQTGSTQNTWIFDDNGTLSVPGDIVGANNLATTGSNTFTGIQTIVPSTTNVLNLGTTLAGDPNQPVDIRLAATGTARGVRLYAQTTEVGVVPNGAALYLFSTSSVNLPGQAYLDSAAHNDAFLSFRTAQTGQTLRERMRITSDGEVKISGSIQISGSIIPATNGVSTTSSFSLGSATNAWKDIFVSNGTINFLDGAGNIQAALSSTTEGLAISGALVVSEIVAPSGSVGSYTGSLEGTASFAVSASHLIGNTSIITASAAASTITFTKADNTTFDIVVAQSGSVESSSYAVFAASADTASVAVNATTASYVENAQSASYVESAQTASYILNAVSASQSTTASYVENAQSASFYAIPVSCYAWTTGYINLTNSVDNNVRWSSEVFNTRSDIFELSGSGTADARIFIKQPGYYEFISQAHFFDLTGNLDMLVKLTSGSSTGALSQVTLFNDSKFDELTADQTVNGNIIINVTTPQYYSVAINPSANSPFPSDTNNTPTRLFIKKLA